MRQAALVRKQSSAKKPWTKEASALRSSSASRSRHSSLGNILQLNGSCTDSTSAAPSARSPGYGPNLVFLASETRRSF